MKDEHRNKVISKYKELMLEKNFLPAVEFAKRFRLHKSLVDDAAFKSWQVEFKTKRFDEALDIKNRFKLSKKVTLPITRSAYLRYMDEKNYMTAKTIRRTYGVPIGLTQWIFELFRIIFGR